MNRLTIDEFVVPYLLIARRCALSKRGAWIVGLWTDFSSTEFSGTNSFIKPTHQQARPWDPRHKI